MRSVHNYTEILPAARLLRYVECYWFRDDLHGTPRHRVLPDGCVDILFSTQNGEPTSLAIVGLMTTPQIIDVRAGQAFFGVRFRPGMAASFLPAAPQLNDRIEPLENVLGSDARHLSHQLAEASSPLGMARLMDTVLRPLNPPDTAQNALQELSIDDGTIEQVASAAALSTRQLRRLCMERAGVSPKYLRRILRFEKQFKGSRSSARTRAGRIGRISLRCADTTIRLTSFENFKSSPVTQLADIYNPYHSRSL